jgi:hypothetical protein
MWAMRGCPITNGNASDDSAMAGIRKAIIPPWKLRYLLSLQFSTSVKSPVTIGAKKDEIFEFNLAKASNRNGD